MPGEQTSKRSDHGGVLKVYKTAIFKLHNPSRRKRAMLIDSMRRAHLAYARLLAQLLKDVDEFAAMTEKERGRRIQQHALRELRARPLGCGAKIGIRVDLVAQVNSYIALRRLQEGARPPTVDSLRPDQSHFDRALEELALLGTDVDRQNAVHRELSRLARPPRLRPLSYYGNIKESYLLLWDDASKRYYAWLNLHPRTSRHAQPIKVEKLIDRRTGKAVNFQSATGWLFPLEFGKSFHEARFIEVGRPQTAKLVHRRERNGISCDEFELHVTFEWRTRERSLCRWLGIDRGVNNIAAYAVVEGHGGLLTDGCMSGHGLRRMQREDEARLQRAQRRGRLPRRLSRRRAWANELVHLAANEIVDLAVHYRARVVLEDLSNLSAIRRRVRVAGTRRRGFNRLLQRVQYEKLRKVVTYKLAACGVPSPKLVGAPFTSTTCPECGHMAKENRSRTGRTETAAGRFACVKCGHADHADKNAARIIAMKGLWHSGAATADKRWRTFDAFVESCALKRKRGSAAARPVPL
jgi:IS605 OrfB family transposase